MDFVGEFLKRNRIKNKFNLSKVSKELNISKSILEDIENDNFPDYIDKVFLIGHIRAYAKYLDLDDNKIVERFKIQISYNSANLTQEVSKPINSDSFVSIPRILSIASIFIFIFGFYVIFLRENNLEPQYAMTPSVPENLLPNLEEAEMELSIEKSAIAKMNKQNENLIESFDQVDLSTTTTTSSAIASLPKNEDKSFINQNITLKFLDPTWIQLRDQKENIILSKLMNKGDEYSYNISDNLNLTAGNAGNIIILINNNVVGKAGKLGEVVDSLIINSNYKN